ncbi:hypothetical protein L1D34_30140 [Vibrio mediterranei]|uniref:hypothetical protein n=1 Tax=Vibrio mediterranei TaxID=689 RepID=UPI001EFE24AC|nr:hypothetical protein [Vibrio mediterranei]MCG9629057.1 hypothetical protein [Vibrio mediterranei]
MKTLKEKNVYQELSELLDEIGYAFDRHELKICTIRAHKNRVIKRMLVKAKELNFDMSTNVAKSILSSIVSQEDIDEQEAIQILTDYVTSDTSVQITMRERLFAAAIRKSEDFHIVMLLNGEGAQRVVSRSAL